MFSAVWRLAIRGAGVIKGGRAKVDTQDENRVMNDRRCMTFVPNCIATRKRVQKIERIIREMGVKREMICASTQG